jgi:hypothetical protein
VEYGAAEEKKIELEEELGARPHYPKCISHAVTEN